MTALWITLAVLGYAVGGMLTGATVLRAAATETCSDSWRVGQDECKRLHGLACWRRRVSIDDPLWGFAALFWPLALPLLGAYLIATHESKPIRSARRVAALERELGIGDHQKEKP